LTALITSGLIQPFDYSIGLLRLIADCLISDSPIPAHAGVVESSMSSVMRGSSLERLASHLTCLGVALHLDVDIQGSNIHAHSTSCVAYKYINKHACTIWCLLIPLHSGLPLRSSTLVSTPGTNSGLQTLFVLALAGLQRASERAQALLLALYVLWLSFWSFCEVAIPGLLVSYRVQSRYRFLPLAVGAHVLN